MAVIVFANQKGGCGKTTHCIQFANYLAEKNREVLLLDLDFQRSLLDRRNEDLNLYDNKPRYEVVAIDIEKALNLLNDFESVERGCLLIDLPGKIDDNLMADVLQKADVIICPFRYDKLTMDSTGFFIKILEHLKVKARLFFIPNNLKKSVKYDAKLQIINILSNYGTVTSEVQDRVAMERVNTLIIHNEAIDIVSEAYDLIIEKCGLN